MTSCDLNGLKVLALLPVHTEERADYLVRLLETMKQRWAWQISIVCPIADHDAYRPLTEPHGLLLKTADYRKATDWESDPAVVARVERELSEAERITGIPTGQHILASQATIGCAFALPYLDFRQTALHRSVLTDNAEPQRLYLRMFGFAQDVMRQVQPDVFLAYEWEKPWRSSIWMAAALRGIPRVAIRRSKLNGDHYFWTSDRTFFNVVSDGLAAEKRRANAPVSDAARKRIAEFRNRPMTVKYIREKWESVGKKSSLKWHADWTRGVVRQAAGGKGDKSVGQLIEYNRRNLQAKRDQKYFQSFDDAALSSMKYVYFPMHKETDLPLVMQAPRWYDQRNTIQVLAGALPYGYRILAREHRMNIGTRPRYYYDQLAKLPNVTLIDPFGDQFRYIRHASLVVTENGSSGWEALLLDRTVIALSRTVYDGAGLARKVTNTDELGAAVLKALGDTPLVDGEERERRLGWMLDAEFESTFSMKLDRAGEGADHLQNILSTLVQQHHDAPALAARHGAVGVAASR